MRREKERKAMLEQVKSGERVLFSGGIIGTVTNIKDDTVMIKVAENVKIEVARGAIIKVLEKGEKAVVEEKK
jgi:preprotein translocase subunit YajC